MTLPQALHDFFQQQKARYDELFWHEVREQKDGGIKLILMIEKLAEKARAALDVDGDILATPNTASPENKVEIVSFEADDSIGEFYLVDAEQINVETRPSKQEYKSIMDKNLNAAFTDLTNDIYKDQLVKVFQPKGYSSFCVIVYHSFADKVPSQIGWIKNLEGLRKTIQKEFLKPRELISFEEACKKLEGVKYQIGGGSLKNGFDCSSLVQKIFYETKGIWLPRKARWQAMVCEPVQLRDLQKGDLVFFSKVEDMKKQINTSTKLSVNGERSRTIDHVALIFEVQPGRLPMVFHAKRNGKAMFEDLNEAKWLFSKKNPDGQWEINGFGRVKEIL